MAPFLHPAKFVDQSLGLENDQRLAVLPFFASNSINCVISLGQPFHSIIGKLDHEKQKKTPKKLKRIKEFALL